jgi:hypothetical protein
VENHPYKERIKALKCVLKHLSSFEALVKGRFFVDLERMEANST